MVLLEDLHAVLFLGLLGEDMDYFYEGKGRSDKVQV